MIIRYLLIEAVTRVGRGLLSVIGKIIAAVIVVPAAIIGCAFLAHHFGYLPAPLMMARTGWDWLLSAPWPTLAGVGLLLLLIIIRASGGSGSE